MSMPSHAGWFDDPADSTQLRYFDGVIWTSHTAPRVTRSSGLEGGQVQPGQQQYPGQGHPPQYPGQPGQPGQVQPGQQQAPYQQLPGAPQQPPQWSAPAYPGSWGRPATPDGQPLASYGQRVGAFLIDWLIQAVIGGVLGSYFAFKALSNYVDQLSSMMNQAQPGQQPDFAALAASIDRGALTIFSLIGIAVFAAYQLFFLTRSGRTPGKAAVGISVRLRERPGPPPAGVVARRIALPVGLFLVELVTLVGVLGLIGRALDLLWPSWDPNRQALHDKVAGTVVVVGEQPRR
jgi:uncharacterized RDD family membrane protein YckC